MENEKNFLEHMRFAVEFATNLVLSEGSAIPGSAKTSRAKQTYPLA